jgi:putative endonuclease
VVNDKKQPWFLYILRCGDDSLYCGVTLDVERRLRGRGPLQLVYSRRFASRSAALRAEAEFKKLPRRMKESLIAQSG